MPRILASLGLLAAVICGASPTAGSDLGRTRVGLVNGKWEFNGQVTHRGAPAEGLLMNVRMVNAVFEDRNKPDFNPEANTDEFIARIPDYTARGVNAFTVCLQGGMPGYEGAVNSAFEPDGRLRPAYLARVERVIRACDRQGAAVILGLYYQRQSAILRDEAAVRAGVVNAARWVREHGFQNVLIEIANEYPHSGFVHALIRDPKGQASLIRLAKETAPGLLVSASGYGDGKVHTEVAEASDYLLPHWNGTTVGQIPERIAVLKRFGKPIVCNEDDKTGANAVAALRASVANGASYGLMLKEHNQTFPFHFDGAADDPVFYAELRALTAPASRPSAAVTTAPFWGRFETAVTNARAYTAPVLFVAGNERHRRLWGDRFFGRTPKVCMRKVTETTAIRAAWRGTAAKPLRHPASGLACLVLVCSCLVTDLPSALAGGPLRVHPDNPRYFTDGTKASDGSLKAVYLTGSHPWNNLQDSGKLGKPLTERFDYDSYLSRMARLNHNLIRVWAWEVGENDWYYDPAPWVRTGPGTGTDGRPKFDLKEFNPEYFERLRSRVMRCSI